MKKILILMVMLIMGMTLLTAQAISDYTFSTATNGSLEDMSSGTTNLLVTGTYYDDVASAITNIGFIFKLGNTAYSQFSINSNGQMQLGTTAISGGAASPALNTPRLAPLSGDNAIRATGKVHYKVTGSAGSRKLIVEWVDLRVPFSSAAETGTYCKMQAVLYETSNKVEYIYGTMYNMSTSTVTRGIYISTSNIAGSIGQILTINTTPAWNTTGTTITNTTFALNSAMTNLDSAADGSRRVFTFEAPAGYPGSVNNMIPANNATGIAVNGNLTWTWGADTDTYDLWFGPTGTMTKVVDNQPAGTASYSYTGLTIGTAYSWQVVSRNATGITNGPVVSFMTAMPAGMIQVGTGTVTTLNLPLNPFYGYNYSQTLYLQPEINVSGQRISKIYYYWNGLAAGINSKAWTVYMGHTNKTVFSTTTDWIASTGMSVVYSGDVTLPASAGWVEITLTNPFIYNNVDNLVIAVDENTAGNDGSSTKFLGTSFATNRGIRYQNDSTNPNPAAPPTGTLVLGIANIRLQFEDIPSAPVFTINPSATTKDFGTVIINTAATQQYTISNTGAGTLTISNPIVASGDYYSISVQPTDWELTAGESTTFTVQYLPTTAAGNPHTGSVTVTYSRTDHVINLTGSCVDPTITTFPYTENFDGVTIPNLPLSWFSIDNNSDGDTWISSNVNPKSTPNCVRIYTDYNTSNDDYLVTPPVVLTGNQRLKFWTRANSTSETDEISVLVSTTTPTVAAFTNVAMASTVINFTTYAQYSVNLSAYSGTCYIAFARRNAPADGWYLYLDDITIEDIQQISPEQVTINFPANGLVTLNNPLLKWTPSGTGEPATGYKVYLNTTGVFTESDVVYDGTATSYQTTTANNTTYFWRVNPYNTYGETTGSTQSFSIARVNQLAESFEPTTFPPTGWLRTTASTTYWGRSTSQAYHGTASMYAYTSSSTPYTISTPLLTITPTSTLNFYTSATATSQVLQILSSPDRTTWTQVGANITYAATNTMYSVTVDLSSLAGGNYYLAFHSPAQSVGTYNIYVDHVIGPDITPLTPGPVTLSTPADAATNVLERPTFTWTAPTTGGVPTEYRIYCDQNNPPTTLIGTATGLNYTATAVLAYETLYYWTVKAYNNAGEGDAPTPRSFTTRSDPTVSTLPYIVDFGTLSTDPFPPVDWTKHSGLLASPTVLGANGTGSWVQDDWVNVTTPANKAAKMNIYSTTINGWLITPPIVIPETGYELKFDIGLTDWPDPVPPVDPEGYSGVDDKFIVLIGDGSSWTPANAVMTWDNDPNTTGSGYAVYNEVPHTGVSVTLPLDSYVGTKYIAFYGESTITNADNDFFVDNVIVRQTPAGLPHHVTLNTPSDGATGLNPNNITLTWTPAQTGGTPLVYTVFLAENPIDPGTEYYGEHQFDTTATSLNLSALQDSEFQIGYSTTWYWAVLPYNGDPLQSPDPAEPGFMVFDFTTIPDPRITAYGYTQNFDGVTAPAFPIGWTGYKSYSSSSIVTSTTYAQSTPNSVYMYNYTTTEQLRLISPEVTLPMNSFRVKFYARGGTNYTLRVGTVSALDGTGVFTQVASVPVTATSFTEYSVSFGSYTGSDQYICIQHGAESGYRSIYIDNFSIEQLLANDMAATLMTGPTQVQVGTPLTYNVTVVNNGTSDATSYNVHLKRIGDDRYASITVTTPLAPGATAVHALNWTPLVADLYQFVGEVELTSAIDGNAANNETAILNLIAYPEGTWIEDFEGGAIPSDWTIRTGDAGLYNWEIYSTFAHGGTYCAAVRWDSSTIQNDDWLITPPLQLSSTRPDAISFWIGQNSTYFLESWEVLISTTDSQIASFTMIDSGTLATTGYIQKAYNLDAYGDAVVYIALRCTSFNELRFYADDFIGSPLYVPAEPVVTIETVPTGVKLSWPADIHVKHYKIYADDDPYGTFSGTPVTTTANEYIITSPEAKKFYKVVASTKEIGGRETSTHVFSNIVSPEELEKMRNQ